MDPVKDVVSAILGVMGFLGLFAYMIFLWITGLIGIEHHLGSVGVIIALALSVFFKLHIHLLIGAFFGITDVYEWHWLVALILVVPTALPMVGVMVFGVLIALYDKFRSHPQFQPPAPPTIVLTEVPKPIKSSSLKPTPPPKHQEKEGLIKVLAMLAVPFIVYFVVIFSISEKSNVSPKMAATNVYTPLKNTNEEKKKPNFQYGYTLNSHVSLYNQPVNDNRNVYTAVGILHILPIDLDWVHTDFYRTILRDEHHHARQVFVKKDQIFIGSLSDAQVIAYKNKCKESVTNLYNNQFLNNIYEQSMDKPHQIVVDGGHSPILVKVIEHNKGVVQTFYVEAGQTARSNLPDGIYQVAFLVGDKYSEQCKTFTHIKKAMMDPKYETFKVNMFSANMLHYTLDKMIGVGDLGFEPNTISAQNFNNQQEAIQKEEVTDEWINRQSQRVDDIEGMEVDPDEIRDTKVDEENFVKIED